MIAQALRDVAEEQSLCATKIAASIGHTEGSARHYLSGRTIPRGDALLRLMAVYPNFALKLGYKAVRRRSS